MSIDGVSQSKLTTLANKLLEQDEDKVITKEEIKEFVKTNEAEFVSLDIDTNQIENELSEILKDNMDESEVDEADNADETNNDNDEISELKSKIKELKNKISGYDTKLTNLNSSLKLLDTQLESEQSKYEKLEQEAKVQNKKLEQIISSIDDATKDMEDDMKAKQKKASIDAVAEYNPDEDGEWDEYIQNYMSNVEIDSSLKTNLSSLVKKSDFIQTNLSSLADSLSSQARKIENLNIQIAATKANISETTSLKDSANKELKTLNTELSQKIAAQNSALTGPVNSTSKIGPLLQANATDSAKTPEDIMNLLSCEERQLIEDNNLDLTEKLCDGSPRYVFAKGGKDGKYHVYDLGDRWSNSNKDPGTYRSIARLYGNPIPGQEAAAESNKATNRYQGGFDICEMGNGWLMTGKCAHYGHGTTSDIYFLDDCNTVKERCNCSYATDSPLSFDLNGDGVKTSSNVIDYDIDGDGELDKINDSADAVLVFDKDGDGISGEDGSEAFGNNTDLDGDGKADGYKDGFEALKALAKKEGLINGSDDNKLDEKDLKLLEEKYGLGIKKDGYLDKTSSFKDAGITEINLSTTDETELIDNFDGQGNQLMRQKGATFVVNGETREYADIWHKKLSDNDIEMLSENNKEGNKVKNNSSLSFNFFNLRNDINKNIKLGQEAKLDSQKAIKKADNMMNNFFIQEPNNMEESKEEKEVQEAKEEELKKEKLEEES